MTPVEWATPQTVLGNSGAVPHSYCDPEYLALRDEWRRANNWRPSVHGHLMGVWPQDDALAHVGIHATDHVTLWHRPGYTHQPGDVLLVETLEPDASVPSGEEWHDGAIYLGMLARMEGDQPVLRFDGPEPWGQRAMSLPAVKILGYVVTVTHEPIMGQMRCAERWTRNDRRDWGWCRSARSGWHPSYRYFTDAQRAQMRAILEGPHGEAARALLRGVDDLIEARNDLGPRGEALPDFEARVREVLGGVLLRYGAKVSEVRPPRRRAQKRQLALPAPGAGHDDAA